MLNAFVVTQFTQGIVQAASQTTNAMKHIMVFVVNCFVTLERRGRVRAAP
jgi:hypothetical protein